jgi:hypothetical protein
MEASGPKAQPRSPGVTINVNSPKNCSIISGDRIEISIHMGPGDQQTSPKLMRFEDSPPLGK